MLPEVQFDKDINIIKIPSKTFKADFQKSIIKGYIDEVQSLVQAIYKIFMTRRYAFAIYDWNYGIEIDDLLGMPKAYIKAEVERRIKDALSTDDRIEEVYEFNFFDIANDRCSLEVQFIVKSIFGNFDFILEVWHVSRYDF